MKSTKHLHNVRTVSLFLFCGLYYSGIYSIRQTVRCCNVTLYSIFTLCFLKNKLSPCIPVAPFFFLLSIVSFRNDLQRIITLCEEDKFSVGDLEQWTEILDLHSRVEDEIIVVALQARLKENKDSNDKISEELLSGNGHDSVKQLISKSLECSDNVERLKLLKELAVELDDHLKIEEENMMHLLIEINQLCISRCTALNVYFPLYYSNQYSYIESKDWIL